MTTRVLITNDDGVGRPGIDALAAVAVELGLEVVVAAPAWDSSGASASITGVSEAGHLKLDERPGAVPGARVLAVEAAPAMIVRAGIRGAFGPPPDLVLSGINDGPNTGHAVLHSGTVGAALTAATHDCPAVAFSLGVSGERDYTGAAEVARRVVPWAVDHPECVVLNVNVPSAPIDEIKGLRQARLAHFGAVQTQVTEQGQGYVSLSFVEIDPTGEPGSDATLLAEGWATVTALKPVCEQALDSLDEITDESTFGEG